VSIARVGSIPTFGTMKDKVKDPDKEARKILERMLRGGNTFSLVARRLNINKGLISYVLNGGHSPTLLRALSLPVLDRKVIEACAECGKIHHMHKTCGQKKRHRVRYRKIAELDSQREVDALTELAEYNGHDNWSAMCRYLAMLWGDGSLRYMCDDNA
jgi:hypothetical protein